MKVYELPAEIQKRIFELQSAPSAELDIEAKPEEGGFAWHLSPEGYLFWKGIWKGYYKIFYEKYPNKPVEKVDTSNDDAFLKLIMDSIEIGPFTQEDYKNFIKKFVEPQTEISKSFVIMADLIINKCSFNLSEHNADELRNAIVGKFLEYHLYNTQ